MNYLPALFWLFALALANFASAQEYQQQSFSPEPLVEQVTRTGKLEFKRTTQLSFKSNGYLKNLQVDEGQVFEKNTQLAALDISELIEQKNATYVQLINAKRDAKRAKKLLKDGVGSEEAVENAETLVETTRANFKIANYNLEKAIISAPFRGLVLIRHSQINELQAPGAPVLTVASLENNWVIRVQLTEQEVVKVRRDQAVDVVLRKIGQVAGVISKVPAIPDSTTNLYTIEVSLPDVAIIEGMIAGQLAKVTLHFKDHNTLVYRVPLSALNGVALNGDGIFIGAQQGKPTEIKREIIKLDEDFAFIKAASNENLTLYTQGLAHLNSRL